MPPRARCSTLFPYTTLFRSDRGCAPGDHDPVGTTRHGHTRLGGAAGGALECTHGLVAPAARGRRDRKSTRLNSSHTVISYAVFCLKKKKPYCDTTRTTHPGT